MKEAKYLYRCRHCGKVFEDCFSGPDDFRAYSRLTDAIYKIVVENQSPLPMIVAHSCSKNKGGVADLIGYEIK